MAREYRYECWTGIVLEFGELRRKREMCGKVARAVQRQDLQHLVSVCDPTLSNSRIGGTGRLREGRDR